MKKILKNKVVFFTCNFLGFLVSIILLFKFFDLKGMGPLSWEEIGCYSPFFIFFSLIFAIRIQLIWSEKTGEEKKKKRRNKSAAR